MILTPYAGTIHKIIYDVFINSEIKYLELGLNDGGNFASLEIKNKTSVDIQEYSHTPHGKPTHLMSTDNFFKQNKNLFDIIYIDAEHEYKQVIRDFNNSVECITENGVIFLHDLYPPDLKHTDQNLCNDSYKILNYFKENNYNIIVNAADYGATCVFNPKKINTDNFNDINYNDLISKYPINNENSIYNNYDDFLSEFRNKIELL